MTFSHFSLRRTRTMATLSRSLFLLRSFGYEQSDPAYFYGNLAEDTAQFIASLYSDRVVGGAPAAALHNARILDVGGGPGFFSEAFTARGSTYITVEPDVGEMAAANIEVPGSVRGSGDALPFADASFDIVYSSNVAEHMPNPWDMGDEMLRVTRPGGLVVLSYTIWLGPFGGHETGLWQHYSAAISPATCTHAPTATPRRTCLGNRFSTSPAPTASTGPPASRNPALHRWWA